MHEEIIELLLSFREKFGYEAGDLEAALIELCLPRMRDGEKVEWNDKKGLTFIKE